METLWDSLLLLIWLLFLVNEQVQLAILIEVMTGRSSKCILKFICPKDQIWTDIRRSDQRSRHDTQKDQR